MVWESGSIVMAVMIFLAGFGFGRLSARRGSLSPAHQPSPASAPAAPVSDDAIDAEIRAGRIIEAIKIYRQRSHADLKTAKRAVELRAAQLGKPLSD